MMLSNELAGIVERLVVVLRNRCEVKRPSQGEPYGLSYPAL